jgi:alpha-beta hydrolase superfamily lysophospholipase
VIFAEQDHLGDLFSVETLSLRADEEGAVEANLVHHPPTVGGAALASNSQEPLTQQPAVLHIHGFNDYFFHTEYAKFWAAKGYNFYAIDLRKSGRSIRSHQTPYYVTDLTTYYEELDLAYSLMTAGRPPEKVLISAHSTGGLIAALWLNDRQHSVSGVVLNSPWFDMAGSALVRVLGPTVIGQVANRSPMWEVPWPTSETYGRSISAVYEGEWHYNLDWKRPGSWPFRAGWLTAIRRGQERLHAGLEIETPILVLSSKRSSHPLDVNEDAHTSDIVLDVSQIRRWAPQLGSLVTVCAISDAKHDVVLSRAPVRAEVYRQLDRWLATYCA